MVIDLVLKDGTVIEDGVEVVRSVAINAGKITQIISGNDTPRARETVDCSGLYVLPGMIDIHVHLRDLKQHEKEDYESGTRAAAAGGVTTVVDMPNSIPPTIDLDTLEEKIEQAESKRYVNVGFYSGLPKDISKFDLRILPHILGLKVYPHMPLTKRTKYSKSRIRACVELASESGLPLLFHPDSSSKSKKPKDIKTFFEKHSCESEVKAIEQFLEARGDIECRLHVCHVSCSTAARAIGNNRAERWLTAEVTPHHLFLAGGETPHENGVRKMLPPLRSPFDNEALLTALRRCVIDCVASDHAPHTIEEKSQEFLKAASGIPGLETTVPLMVTEVFKKHISWVEYFRYCCSGPARIIGIPSKGVLAEGFDADITVVAKEEYQIEGAKFQSKAKLTPFEGRTVLARPVITIVEGEVVYSYGDFTIERGVAGRIPLRKLV